MQAQTIDSVDKWLLEMADSHRHPILTWFARLLMDAGHTIRGVAVCVLIALAIVMVFRLWRPAMTAVLAFLFAGQIAELLKNLFDRPRPPASLAIVPAYGYSMPSSVAAVTSASAVAVLVVVSWTSQRSRRLALATMVAAVMVSGAAMVYLGAHWASDVLAGWALGSLIGLGVGMVCRERPKIRSAVRST